MTRPGVGASLGLLAVTVLVESMLCDADGVMYRAKQRGKGRVELEPNGPRVAVA